MKIFPMIYHLYFAKRASLLGFFIFFIYSISLQAQSNNDTSCVKELYEAEEAYKEGSFENAETILEDILERKCLNHRDERRALELIDSLCVREFHEAEEAYNENSFGRAEILLGDILKRECLKHRDKNKALELIQTICEKKFYEAEKAYKEGSTEKAETILEDILSEKEECKHSIIKKASELLRDISSCARRLDRAEELYDRGSLERIPSILEECLENKNEERSSRIRAYKLAILSYSYMDKKTEAQQFLNKMLLIDPEYKTQEEDSKEFESLYDDFKIRPLVSIGPFGGINFSQPYLDKNFGIDNSDNDNQEYESSVGFWGGISAEFLLYKNLFIILSPQYTLYNFTLKDSLIDFTSATIEETSSWVRLPISLRYNFLSDKRLQPYIQVGTSFNMLLESSVEIIRDATGAPQAIGPAEDLTNLRKSFTYSLIGGIGFKYKIRHAYLFIQGLYNYDLFYQHESTKRYNTEDVSNDLIFKYGYIENDFRFDAVSLSLGFMYTFYKVKVKKGREK